MTAARTTPTPSSHYFAAHTGTAPLEASSSQVVGHRLSRAGDRKLNHALYMVAMVPVRRPSTGQAYYRRKLAEGKSSKEALRCLKAPAVGRGLLLLARRRVVRGCDPSPSWPAAAQGMTHSTGECRSAAMAP